MEKRANSLGRLIINHYDEDDQESHMLEAFACRKSKCKSFFSIFSCLTIFPIFLIYLSNSIYFKMFFKFCEPKKATHIWAKCLDNSYELIHINEYQQKNLPVKRKILFRYLPYELVGTSLVPIKFNINIPCNDLVIKFKKRHETFLKEEEIDMNRFLYGECMIRTPLKTPFQIGIEEVISPFYIFQIMSVSVWMYENYYNYSFVIILLSFFSFFSEIYNIRKNMIEMRRMADNKITVNLEKINEIKLTEGDKDQPEEPIYYIKTQSTLLVPGDIFEIKAGMKIPCDAILMQGSCQVDESMLTGESIPVPKASLVQRSGTFNIQECSVYTLFEGTTIQTIKTLGHQKVLAQVINTGFCSVKGSLFRYMLYPRINKFKFESDSYKFMCFFSIFAIGYFILDVTSLGKDNLFEAFIRFLDILTVIVPPSLPAALSFGVMFSIERLKKTSVTCISPSKMNVAGTINLICFDKTGTLTENSLKLSNLIPYNKEEKFGKTLNSRERIIGKQIFTDKTQYMDKKNKSLINFYECLGCCHTIIESNNEEDPVQSSKLEGDPLETEMFKYSGFKSIGFEKVKSKFNLNKEFANYYQIDCNEDIVNIKGVAKVYEFQSYLQRMSVVTYNSLDDSLTLYIKGSPESIKELSHPESIPENYDEIYKQFTFDGFRVIALGYKNLDYLLEELETLERKEAEEKVNFLGFIIFENGLKNATISSIKELKKANIRTIMLTGDNLWTSSNIARRCNILNNNYPIYASDFLTNQSMNWILLNPSENNKLPAKIQLNLNNPNEYTKNKNEDEFNIGCLIKFNPQFAISTFLLEHILKCDPQLRKESTRSLLRNTNVFARLSPDQKAYVVKFFQEEGLNVGMCGDGANDCKALKQADIGISLGVSEASIAGPFLSKTLDISSVSTIIKEGRASLMNSIQCFKFISLYSFIQFFVLSYLFLNSTSLTDNQLLIQDLCIITPLTFTMGWTKPSKYIEKISPIVSLISFPVIFSLACNFILSGAFILYSANSLYSEKFYVPFKYNKELDYDSNINIPNHLNIVLSIISNLQLVFISVALTFGGYYREAIYKNIRFALNILIYVLGSVLIFFSDWAKFHTLCSLYSDPPLPMEFKKKLILLFIYYSIMTLIIEPFLIQLILKYLYKEPELQQELKGKQKIE